MRVTVADCLDLDAFRGAEVVAGKINLTNDVKAVSVPLMPVTAQTLNFINRIKPKYC